ncbi:hypothetical protein [Arthrobacter sp. B1I2]|uniref:hypothetical protein n=1 Tax=Arthrobacter sp. B1I2 TaxID=3042263 RepID=UPI002783E1A7|nr:hypothetical protein [Arthrobacter sp. B1I2]MDQ0733499.1 hypothetical protein [Arthrobacter sp. B1I2]
MSTYRSSTASLNASVVNLAGNVSAEYDALLQGMCSVDAANLAAEIATTPLTTVAAAQSAWERIDQVLPNWQVDLPTPAIVALKSARTGSQPLPTALGFVAHSLASLERLAIADVSSDVLATLGYALQRVDGQRTSAIEARRGHETLLVAVEDQGRITTDHAGLADNTCSSRQNDYVEAMRQRGVLFDDEITVQHHDPRGGSPIANAARHGGPSLAAGAVIEGDGRNGSLTTSLSKRGKRNSQRLTEGGIR